MEIIARYATNEPRIIPFRIAEGRSRYQLAEALEVANDLQGARKMHELASNAGLRTSTIVLRRWYLEGFAGTVRDHQRLENWRRLRSAKRDCQPGLWRSALARTARCAANSKKSISQSPATTIPSPTKCIVFARYKNAELTDAARKIAMNFYEFARSKNATVAKVLDALKTILNRLRTFLSTTVSVDVNRAREALEKRAGGGGL